MEKGDWSARAREAVLRADKVVLRTALTASAETLKEAGIAFESLDGVYERSRNFRTLTKNLAAEVVRRAAGVTLCYCVDGGVHEDACARLLLRRRDACAIEGVTKGAYCAAKANLGTAVMSVSAYEVGERELSLPLVVYDIDSRGLAADVKLCLAERFGDEAPAYLLRAGKGKRIPLYEADRAEGYDSSCMLAVFDAPLLEKKRFSLFDFMQIMRRLRAPDGCPWDRVQTHESIRINLIEEAYELLDAIDLDDPDKMCEEAGDVLMQAAFHTLMEEERRHFTMTDVISGLCTKLITRHTHVFGGEAAEGAEGALSVWDKNKMTEKHQKTYSDAVNDVPACFPALLRAQKIAKRMAKGGYPVSREGAERALAEALLHIGTEEKADAALGKALMAVAQLAYLSGADAEQALLDEAKRAQRAYTAFEALVRADGKDVSALSEEERKAYQEKADVART